MNSQTPLLNHYSIVINNTYNTFKNKMCSKTDSKKIYYYFGFKGAIYKLKHMYNKN